MKKFLLRLGLTATTSLVLASLACAGVLDEQYLARFGVATPTALQKAVALPTAVDSALPKCGTPDKHGLQRDWNKLEATTQKTLAKQLAAPVLTGTDSTKFTLISPSGRFTLHYTTAGGDAVPSILWVQTVAQTFDEVANAYISRGWRLAPTNSVDGRYHVYLRDLAPARLYGLTTSDASAASTGFLHAFSSFLEIDNNYTDSIYTDATGGPYTPLESLQITAAHEYHHAIQYGYNFFFDVWYAEATSTWQEAELYGNVGQNYNYIAGWLNNTTASLDLAVGTDATGTGAGYGRWIFNRYLAEQHGTGVIKTSWDRLATLDPPGNNADIRMVPVLETLLIGAPFNTSLGADFFGFTKRVYTRGWTNPTDENRVHLYVPVGTYSAYPVNSTASSPVPSITLPHYSFAYYKFRPAAIGDLTITVTKTSGIQTAVFKKTAGTISEIGTNAGAGSSYTIVGFGALNPATDEVVLLITNTTDADNHVASFSTDGTINPVTEPSTASTDGGGGGGGGCFIATAAYGSYLHPQVQVLRDFRDHVLLTNAPGRAFVALYYQLSPPVADFIARHESLRMLVRLMLAPLIFAVKYPLVLGGLLMVAAGASLYRVRRLTAIADSHAK
ncbi:MXAN_6640 family putative metalloprotease [Pelotalea chapellei]|uniref:Uncharacterized protein n=1 Tax=Pelotalea chapellei TaxID=44671 RepID=A0ABS5U572_9BACT|nr:MXAN_6640 family putative metalloprotease [Pelotalea chapellei]MBT1070815.1 hypothetical protein [Pelotalea chapellei]